MTELQQIITGLQSEICPLIQDERQREILNANFERALELTQPSGEAQLAYLQGQVDAFTLTITNGG